MLTLLSKHRCRPWWVWRQSSPLQPRFLPTSPRRRRRRRQLESTRSQETPSRVMLFAQWICFTVRKPALDQIETRAPPPLLWCRTGPGCAGLTLFLFSVRLYREVDVLVKGIRRISEHREPRKDSAFGNETRPVRSIAKSFLKVSHPFIYNVPALNSHTLLWPWVYRMFFVARSASAAAVAFGPSSPVYFLHRIITLR